MTSLFLASNPLFGANSRGIILFGFEIYYYALCIVAGIIVATSLSALLMKRRNMSSDFIFTLFVFCIPVALLCTRLFYCITQPLPFNEWFSWQSIRQGGLSIVGGALGGVGTGFVVCKVKKISFLRAADCVVITILIAQAIGRWGNYFNQEVYGGLVTDPALQWFPFAVHIGNEWHYAFFFYESVINTGGFALLYTFAWKWAKKPNGLFVCSYFVWYGTVRSVMEPLRDPKYILSGGGVPWSLVFSILMIVGGAIGIGLLLFFNYRKEGALIGSKNGDPCGITEFIPAYKDEVPYFSKINMLGANYPPMPEEETTRYKRQRFAAKVKGWFTRDKAEPEEQTERPERSERSEQAERPEQPGNGQTEDEKK